MIYSCTGKHGCRNVEMASLQIFRNLSSLYYRTFLDDDLIEKLKLIGTRRSHWMQREWLVLDIMAGDKLRVLAGTQH